jgi:hypothetical protein
MAGGQQPGSGANGQHPPARADERRALLREVGCDRCGAAVLAAKFSPQHTSVQWSPQAVRACAEFGARTAAGEQTALIDGCGSLRASIDRAVAQGRLEVSAP